MKFKLPITAVLFTFLLTSCAQDARFKASAHTSESSVTAESKAAADELADQDLFQNEDLDELAANFHFPPDSQEDFEIESEAGQFPPKLIEDLAEAVRSGETEALFHNKNQENLMISTRDFVFQPSKDKDMDRAEKDLYEAIQTGAGSFLIYQCDVDKDGADEIIMVENLKYDYSFWNRVFLLKKSGDKYIYSGYDYLGYYRFFSIFKYDGSYYLLANYDDYQTGVSKAVGLFSMDGGQSGFMWLCNNKYTYVRKTSNGYRHHLLYENQENSITENVKTYIDEIGTDLIYTERIHKTFYGDESRESALLEKARNSDRKADFWPAAFTVDADNDGQEELFTRRGGADSVIRWYDSRTFLECGPPNDVWEPDHFKLSQVWFKTIDNKTVAFSLYRRDGQDVFLLDARLHQDGRTVILADYFMDLDIKVCLSDYWDYDDSNKVQIDYKDPDFEKAFPDDMTDWADSFARKVRGEFCPVDFEDEDIPNGLILDAEKKLFTGTSTILDSKSASLEIDREKFFNRFFPDIDEEDIYGPIAHLVYGYQLDQDDYYLTVADSGGSARFVDIEILRETDGSLTAVDHLTSLDMDARVIQYGGQPYLVEEFYNYYSKYNDTINISKLVPGETENYVSVVLEPVGFEWKKVFDKQMACGDKLDSYVDEIKEEVMEKSPINDNIQVFAGDETTHFDHDKLLRLRSVAGDYNYYEIDFNNDGEMEYLSKRFWFPSNYTTLYLINNIYKFADRRIVKINNGFHNNKGTLIQMWFKEIDGKVFTFSLYLRSGYNYFLNVSLIEGTRISQAQTYLIAPKLEFNISRQGMRGVGKG